MLFELSCAGFFLCLFFLTFYWCLCFLDCDDWSSFCCILIEGRNFLGIALSFLRLRGSCVFRCILATLPNFFEVGAGAFERGSELLHDLLHLVADATALAGFSGYALGVFLSLGERGSTLG